jgi:pyruvate dehydrogenase E2 component (dihydrolipoamide acetyltransferase)
MPTNVIMPQMGESIVEGTITKWLKKIGDKVQRDEPLFEISTEKVDSEIPSPAAGILQSILVPAGRTVQINTVLAVIEGEAATAPGPPTQAEATARIPAVESRRIPEPLPAGASIVAVPAAPLKTAAGSSATAVEPKSLAPTPGVGAPEIRTSPLVRRIARENNIDIGLVPGTGLDGRITKDDILNYLARMGLGDEGKPAGVTTAPASGTKIQEDSVVVAARATAPVAQSPTVEAASTQAPAAGEIQKSAAEAVTVPMTQMRRMIAEHMVLSRRTSAHVSTVFEVDMTAIVRLREQHKDEFELREGAKLTYTPFFAKALVETVREFPAFNASVSGDSIIYKKAINVGIAVSLDKGLIVPVVNDAHLKSFTGLALAINDMALRARTKRLKPDEAQNGTISITNPGIYGPLFATPIINQPQVAILGIGGIEKRPVVVGDAIAIRSMVYLALSFDHRVIDGALADQFMAHMKGILQAWTQWRE